jgi:hypothetical protein
MKPHTIGRCAMDLSLAIFLSIGGAGTIYFALWIFSIWKTGGLNNFCAFGAGETVANETGPSPLKEVSTKKEFWQ